jgi:hypothetical protein
MTVPKVVLNITTGKRDPALFYVAVSRVKRLQDLIFEEGFSLKRLSADGGPTAFMRDIDWRRRSTERQLPLRRSPRKRQATQELTRPSQRPILTPLRWATPHSQKRRRLQAGEELDQRMQELEQMLLERGQVFSFNIAYSM